MGSSAQKALDQEHELIIQQIKDMELIIKATLSKVQKIDSLIDKLQDGELSCISDFEKRASVLNNQPLTVYSKDFPQSINRTKLVEYKVAHTERVSDIDYILEEIKELPTPENAKSEEGESHVNKIESLWETKKNEYAILVKRPKSMYVPNKSNIVDELLKSGSFVTSMGDLLDKHIGVKQLI